MTTTWAEAQGGDHLPAAWLPTRTPPRHAPPLGRGPQLSAQCSLSALTGNFLPGAPVWSRLSPEKAFCSGSLDAPCWPSSQG